MRTPLVELSPQQEQLLELESRRRQARQAAEACTALLKSQFGAKRVILFGSLVGQGVWHDQSDLDLAVEGLDPADFFKAYSACSNLLPRDLDLDLVALEDVYPELRARILGEVEMPDNPILALKLVVDDELISLERVTQQMEELLAQAAQPPNWIELRAIATLIHEFYNGLEKIFERIAVSLGEGLPKSSYWHADLLAQMAIVQSGVRAAVIDEPLRPRLEEYLKFRHFFRHAYSYTLEWKRMRWQAEQMGQTLQLLREQLQTLFDGQT